jgi:hypothetical protein
VGEWIKRIKWASVWSKPIHFRDVDPTYIRDTTH